MLLLLYSVVLTEAMVIMLMLFKTPLRKIVIKGLDQVKGGRGPIVVKTVAGAVIVGLIPTVYSVIKIRQHWTVYGDISPTDQVLMSRYLLEASLMGIFLFLVLMVDRVHHYIREIRLRRKSMLAMKKSDGIAEEIKAREEQIGTFKEMVKQMKSELQAKGKEVDAAEASVIALRKQSEGFLLEYDRLLAENQELRALLQSLDQRYSKAPLKKNS